MLENSRSSSSGSALKESTDINALTDEYLRLAYHGLRAKDKSFNETMNTVFVVVHRIEQCIIAVLTN